MGDVRDQPPLPLHRCVDAAQHPVHGRGQPADLVASTVVGDPEVELVGADRVDLGPDLVQPRQRPAQHQPDHEGERHKDQWATDHEGPPQSAVASCTASRLEPTTTVTSPSGAAPSWSQTR